MSFLFKDFFFCQLSLIIHICLYRIVKRFVKKFDAVKSILVVALENGELLENMSKKFTVESFEGIGNGNFVNSVYEKHCLFYYSDKFYSYSCCI